MSHRVRVSIFSLILLLLCCIVSGAGIAKARHAEKNVRLSVLSTTALSTLDPIQSVDITQYDLCNQIFEGLISVDMEGNFAPGLAVRWEHSADYKLWTFYLRDAVFADDPSFPGGKGRKITADDVLYSFLRGLSPQRGSKGAFALSRAVVGAREFSEGKRPDVPGLRAPKPGVIEIELVAGDRFFPAALTVPATYVVPREAVERYGADFGRKPVGSGPFRLERWREGSSLTLLRNLSYGQGAAPQPPVPEIDRVEFRFFRSEAQILNAFNAGEVDIRPVVGADIATLPPKTWQQTLRAEYPKADFICPGWILKLHLLAPQMGAEHPLGGSDGQTRRALRQILSQQQAAIDAFRGIGVAQDRLLPPQLTGLEQKVPIMDDAQRILKTNLAGRTIRVAYASSRTNDILVTLLEKTLTAAGAKTLKFPSTSVNALLGSLATIKPDLTVIYWSPYYPNVSEFLTGLLTSSQPVPNFTGFSSPELDALYGELVSGGRDVKKVTAEIDSLLNAAMPWIPLYMETPYYLVAKNISGFAINPVSVTQLVRIRVK